MHNKGFTLIEIVMVVIILTILAGVAMPRYNKAVEQARVAEAKNMLGAIREAEIRYATENDVYPSSLNQLDINATTGRYFTWFMLNQVAGAFFDSNDDLLAQALRNNFQCCGGYSTYTINIYESGNFTVIGINPPPV